MGMQTLRPFGEGLMRGEVIRTPPVIRGVVARMSGHVVRLNRGRPVVSEGKSGLNAL